MTRRDHQTDNTGKQSAEMHSESFVALVELVRHMARCAAEYDYEAMQKAVKDNQELISEWKNKQ